MPPSDQPDLLEVDWTKIPAPADDGAVRHLTGTRVPDVALHATDGTLVSLAKLPGRVVVFAYPRTGRPGEPALVEDWDQIPGARGCTPQSCAFRDLHGALLAASAAYVFGLSTQATEYQREAVKRLHLPFAILSDFERVLIGALELPTFNIAGQVLVKRLAMVIEGARVTKVFYPVFPPDRNASEVLAWLGSAGKHAGGV